MMRPYIHAHLLQVKLLQVKQVRRPCLPAKPLTWSFNNTTRRSICRSSSSSTNCSVQADAAVVCNPAGSTLSSPLPGLASPGSKAAAADKGANPAAPLLGLLLEASSGALTQWPSWLVVLLVRAIVVAGEGRGEGRAKDGLRKSHPILDTTRLIPW
jgi:hypothetical protein